MCWARFPPATPPPKCNCRFILNSVAQSVTLHSNPFHPTPSLTHSTYLNIPLLCVPLCILLHLTFCHCFLSFFSPSPWFSFIKPCDYLRLTSPNHVKNQWARQIKIKHVTCNFCWLKPRVCEFVAPRFLDTPISFPSKSITSVVRKYC